MKKNISKEYLMKVYQENTTAGACRILGITIPTLISYLKSAGIKTKGKGNRQPKRKILIVED